MMLYTHEKEIAYLLLEEIKPYSHPDGDYNAKRLAYIFADRIVNELPNNSREEADKVESWIRIRHYLDNL